jgi:pimeloyl-ACP methyl ester carboxylesterase
MAKFYHGDVEIAYLDQGTGDPVVMVHGFASNKEVNWLSPGWFTTLTTAGYRAIAIDNRGHGKSSKLYQPSDYHSATMADDIRALLDHLGIPRADLIGYSMGSRISGYMALNHPDRIRSVTFGGLGIRLVDGVGLPDSIADALLAPSLAEVGDPVDRTFRAFAEQTRSDLKALAACIRGSRQIMARDEVAGLRMPVLVAVGSDDAVAGSAQQLAAIIPGASALDIPGRDHMLAVGDKVFKQGVLDFLKGRP